MDANNDSSYVKYEISKSSKDAKTFITVQPPRPEGNELTNQYCRSLLELVRCNQDMKIICDGNLCYHYLLKYVTK